MYYNEGSDLPIYHDKLPVWILVRTSGPAAAGLGFYTKLPGLPPVWEHSISRDHKLAFDGENEL